MAIPSPTNDQLAGSLVDSMPRDSAGEIASILLRDSPQGELRYCQFFVARAGCIFGFLL